ncbi:MAG: anaerobic ribonucleoside-triphosphate reductase activating protein [Clostridiales bacterium]|nr:anaerobic ribonucleoside-triphosphate reductase activating protein [Candidatus Blautia equi]
MKICGLNKTTLLDYPGKVAATIFLGGCNFRCPFCQNGALVLHPATEPEITQEYTFSFLQKRRGILDGVCVTGGEPTLAPDLADFLREIKEMGYLVKLDTNGSRPDVIKDLASQGLLDMVAMDIKSCPSAYGTLTGLDSPDMNAIQESVDFLLHGSLDYEFRTTVMKELHHKEDFAAIGQWIAGAKAYYLQAYRESPDVIQPGFSSCTLEELQEFRDILLKTIPVVEIRGID